LLAYARPRGRAFLDRELDLPPEWVEDRQRRKEAGVPETVEFPTKPQRARAMLERAVAVQVPFRWVTGDAVDGGDRRLRLWLAEHDLAHVLAVKSTEPLWALTTEGPLQVSAAALAAGVRDEAWRQLSAGDGAKGPRLDDWARGRVRPFSDPERGYWLLVRRSLSDPTDRARHDLGGLGAHRRGALDDRGVLGSGERGGRPRSLRGPSLGRLVSPRHAGFARPRLSGGNPPPRSGGRGKGGGVKRADETLLPLTVPEVRRLLWRLVWAAPRDNHQVLAWSTWRRRHQARARRCHYQRRLARCLA